MARQFSMPYQIPPVSLLPPAADAAGRTGSYRNLASALKAYVVVHINQGNAAQVTVSLLQAQDVSGTGSKAVGVVPIWLTAATATSDALAADDRGLAAFFQSGALEIFRDGPMRCRLAREDEAAARLLHGGGDGLAGEQIVAKENRPELGHGRTMPASQ